MTEISMPAWMFALVIAGTALSASALVAWGMAIIAMAAKPVPTPESALDAIYDQGYNAGRGDEHDVWQRTGNMEALPRLVSVGVSMEAQ